MIDYTKEENDPRKDYVDSVLVPTDDKALASTKYSDRTRNLPSTFSDYYDLSSDEINALFADRVLNAFVLGKAPISISADPDDGEFVNLCADADDSVRIGYVYQYRVDPRASRNDVFKFKGVSEIALLPVPDYAFCTESATSFVRCHLFELASIKTEHGILRPKFSAEPDELGGQWKVGWKVWNRDKLNYDWLVSATSASISIAICIAILKLVDSTYCPELPFEDHSIR